MFFNRMLTAMVAAVLILVAGVGPAAAAKPVRPVPPSAPAPTGERPPTPEERALSDAKIAIARAFVRGAGRPLVGLNCATPQSSRAEVGSPAVGGLAAGNDATINACTVPSAFLSVQPRQQTKNHYCGPAVGQVIANYSWKVASGANKYTQDKIAEWMKTNVFGQTNAPELAAGLQKATAGSPRHPAGFAWGFTNLQDLDANRATADELHDYVRTAVSHWRMPLAIAVKPHDRNSQFHLSSWPNEVNSPGHWVAAYGWYSFFIGTHGARVYFADSSKNQGGGTGTYWNSTLSLATMIGEHTGRFVW